MFFWFIGMAIVSVGYVFRDPRFDYRLLIVGSVLPLLDGLFGGARALHSITVPVVLLAIVMLVTGRGSGRHSWRRFLLGLPIGMLLALVFDAAWSDTQVFWWPLTGWSFDDEPLPVVERGAVSVLLEVIGLAVCVWLWRRNDMSDRSHRKAFLLTGTLHVVGDPPANLSRGV